MNTQQPTPQVLPLLEVANLRKYFNTPGGAVHAVDDVSFSINKGETFGLVGESGCGKSTLGRVLIRLINATAGTLRFKGEDILNVSRTRGKELRRQMQIVFQDPYSCLNPRFSVSQIISEPFFANGLCSNSAEMRTKVLELMDVVGIARRLADSYPHELDGGRRQRIGIARSLALNPEFIVLDEPVSALDVCIQAQMLNLLTSLKKEFGYTYIFITHNMSVVKHLSDRIAVMYLGQIVEMADYRQLFASPLHPYTEALLSAIPVPRMGARKQRITLEGDVPSPINPPTGCRFAGRCRYRQELCLHEMPVLIPRDNGHSVACHYPLVGDAVPHSALAGA